MYSNTVSMMILVIQLKSIEIFFSVCMTQDIYLALLRLADSISKLIRRIRENHSTKWSE